jgi:hypothetical protein
MQIFLNNRLIRALVSEEKEEKKNFFMNELLRHQIIKDRGSVEVKLDWPSLLEYLGVENLFQSIRLLDEQHELFKKVISMLSLNPDKESLFRLYDQLFVESLLNVQSLSQLDPAFLVDQIQKRKRSPFLFSDWFFSSLNEYEERLIHHTSHTIHDLTLYLAWDRVCTNLAILFDYEYSELNFQHHLSVLKECLIESFQHITQTGRTSPGFFRLVEALFAYQMRSENLQSHSEEEWSILCHSFPALKPRELLAHVGYVDHAIANEPVDSLVEFTLDSIEQVKAGLDLSRYTVQKLKSSVIDWNFALHPLRIVCLKQVEDGLMINQVINIE